MADYRKLYSILFNSITDALELLEHEDLQTAKMLLIAAQQKTEDAYIEEE